MFAMKVRVPMIWLGKLSSWLGNRTDGGTATTKPSTAIKAGTIRRTRRS
jgi:hypothetical protein